MVKFVMCASFFLVPATDSREAAEAHFSRLLARYNKLKIAPGDWKDVESLMQVKCRIICLLSLNLKVIIPFHWSILSFQRMLQLSDRYSAQSSIMLSPKSLRRMFESDYGINNGGRSLFSVFPFFTANFLNHCGNCTFFFSFQ